MELDRLENWERSHQCGELTVENLGQEVTLMGWVNARREHGGVTFIDLRDITGFSQIVFSLEANQECHKKAASLRAECVIAIRGKVEKRGEANPNIKTGEVEVYVQEIKLLNFSQPLPFQVASEEQESSEKLRLTHRYLDLRRKAMQENLVLRSKATQITHEFFSKEGFHNIETPVLTKSTPEGARDFLVPSRMNPGEFYALPQSPQLFKQLFMVSGFERYYQVVKCFRDEDLRGNRQPEFTQVDVELAFTNPEEVYRLIEQYLVKLFKETLGYEISLPIPRMTYDQAMTEYGSDAPDLRFDLKLKDLSEIVKGCEFKVFTQALESGGSVRAICVPGGAKFSRKDLDNFTDFVKIYRAKGLAWAKIKEDGSWQSPIAKFFNEGDVQTIAEATEAKAGDLLLFAADKNKVVFDALGNLRKEIARKLDLVDDQEFKFTWVTDFPLLEYDEEEQRYSSTHHPFTMPNEEDLAKWGEEDPSKIKSIAYDIVLNGVELGGGSIRIHRKDIQEKMFQLLNLSDEEARGKFGFLLDALDYGAPPHGGVALGFDRIIMFLVGTSSIRDVIAFPKTQQGTCLLTEAPSAVDDVQLNELALSIQKREIES